MKIFVAAFLLLTSCSSESDLMSLCRDQVAVQKRIQTERDAGRSITSELRREFAAAAEKVNRYPEEQICQAMKKIPGSGFE